MFRNVFNTGNEYLRRALDYLSSSQFTSSTNLIQNNQTQIDSFDIDINNNNKINNYSLSESIDRNFILSPVKVSENKNIISRRKRSKAKRTRNRTKTENQSLIDEFDWFKQIDKDYASSNRENSNFDSDEQSSSSSYSSSNESTLAFDSYYDYLTKFYSIEPHKTAKTKKSKNYYHNNKMANQVGSQYSNQPQPYLLIQDENSSMLTSTDYYAQNDLNNSNQFLFNTLLNGQSPLITNDDYQINFNQQISTSSNDSFNSQNSTINGNFNNNNCNIIKAVRLFQKLYYKEKIKGQQLQVPSWRMKEKMKTVSAALVLCLNIGVDPPDVVKSNQCSKLECWINQMTQPTPQKALEMIGCELQKQYERWQPRARYKHCLDPTSEDVKKLCISLRKNAKEERVLFHYNGHGVPRPTINGEIWVFNKEFTQYIPLSLYEVQTWMGTPSLYVWDCSNAGLIVQSFLQFEEDRENELLNRANDANLTPRNATPNSTASSNNTNNTLLNGTNLSNSSNQTLKNFPNQTSSPMTPQQQQQTLPNQTQTQQPSVPKIRDSIHLAACSANELLPQHPDLPMDLFTACLTTPIKTALHWYVAQKNSCQLIPGLTIELLEKIPGQINDRRTMMGELNWIFTAITDTIAWNVLDSDLFQKLFRQDLLVASLFRNFLLAERIMKSLDCNPVSHPSLPSTSEHPLWQSWDLALDMCISQLPHIFNSNGHHKDFVSCGFFTEQIEIFDVWLRYNVNSHSPPEQLPVVLQVLLSQQHRLKALELLAKFIDFGPWAVSSALSVGIFPYVLKLLTTQPRELRPLLTFIWAKILAVDKSCQAELVKDNGHVYFIHVLSDPDVEPTQKVYSAFVLSCLVDNYPTGQESAKQNHLIAACSYLLTDERTRDYKNSSLRQWVCICLGLCWQNYPEARWEGVRNNAHQYLIKLISDPVPEVRAAAIFALGTYIGCGQGNEATVEQTNKIDSEIVNALIKETDMVYMVRKELIAALYNYIYQFMSNQAQSSSNSNSNSPSIYSSTSQASNSGQESPVLSSNKSSTSSGIESSSSQITRSRSEVTLNQPNRTNINSSATVTNPKKSNQSNINTIIEASNANTTPTNLNNSISIQSNHTQPTLSQSINNQNSLNIQPMPPQAQSLYNTNVNFNPSISSSQLSAQGTSTSSVSQPQPLTKRGNLAQPPNKFYQNQHNPTTPNLRGPLNGNNQTNNSLMFQNNYKHNLFNSVWNLLVEMLNDPYPDVAELAQKVVSFFLSQVHNFDSIKQAALKNTTIVRQLQNLNLNSNNIIKSIEISTEFVPWCCKYFLKPLLSTQSSNSTLNNSVSSSTISLNQSSLNQFKEEDLLINQRVDLYTTEYLDQHCKLLYNFKRKRIPSEWKEPQQMEEVIQIKHSAYPVQVKFHPFDEQLFVADKDCMVHIYETINNCSKLSSFSILPQHQQNTINKMPIMTSFKLINIQHEPILLTGTDDRVVRFFKPDLINFKQTNLITSFSAFKSNEIRESNIEAGLTVEWDEPNETLLCAGDNDYIRVWDMNKELYKDYPTFIKSCVCSLSTSDNFTVAGFGDGTIKLFDFRRSQSAVNFTQLVVDSPQQPISSKLPYLSAKLFVHDSFVLKVKLHKQSNKLITSGTSGDINIFDIRSMRKALETSFNNEKATCLECHPYNELIAVANSTAPNQSIKIYDFKGKELSNIKHHDGFYGKRISTVSCLDWNMHKNELLFGSYDNCLTVFRCKN